MNDLERTADLAAVQALEVVRVRGERNLARDFAVLLEAELTEANLNLQTARNDADGLRHQLEMLQAKP